MNMVTDEDIRCNIDAIREAIGKAALKSCCRPDKIKLVAVTKTVPADRVRVALDCGIRFLGENRVQEAMEKRTCLGEYGFEYHLIGTLQKNKVNKAVPCFDWIQSVDSAELAQKISQAAVFAGKVIPVLLQVNLGGEETKSGTDEESLFALAVSASTCAGISVRGLMAIPPFLEDPEAVRPYFAQLRELAAKIKQMNLPKISMNELSMGMSHDFSVAVEEGATMVRIGTAIFGERYRA